MSQLASLSPAWVNPSTPQGILGQGDQNSSDDLGENVTAGLSDKTAPVAGTPVKPQAHLDKLSDLASLQNSLAELGLGELPLEGLTEGLDNGFEQEKPLSSSKNEAAKTTEKSWNAGLSGDAFLATRTLSKESSFLKAQDEGSKNDSEFGEISLNSLPNSNSGQADQNGVGQGMTGQGDGSSKQGQEFGGSTTLGEMQKAVSQNKERSAIATDFESKLESRSLAGSKKNSGKLQSGVFEEMNGVSAAPTSSTIANTLQSSVQADSAGKTRISDEGIQKMASQIQNMSSVSGRTESGEMRIRLNPENLGELHLRVQTDGAGVKLQIQASDEKAKKIIEESINELQDSLSAKNLNLSSVHVALAGGLSDSSSNPDNSNGNFSGFQNFASQSQQSGLNFNQNQHPSSQQQQASWNGREQQMRSGSLSGNSLRMNGFRSTQAASSAGRLDVIA